jgi:PAS domain S-box-containing protein
MPLSSKTLAKIIDGSAVPSFVINKMHRVTHWNTALEALTGRRREEVIGKNDQWKSFYNYERPTLANLIVCQASLEEIEKYYPNKCKESPLIKGAYEAEDFFPALAKNGKWLHFTASPIKDNRGLIIGAIETLIDTTERKVLEDNLHYYLYQITRAQEEERKHIARELHDDMAQTLGSMARDLDNLLRKKHSFKSGEVAALQDIQNSISQGLQSVNSFIRNLRPSLLDDLGLIPALRSLTNSLEKSDGIVSDFTVTGEERRFTDDDELSLFRIVQEALNNIKKHAQASEVHVLCEFTDNGIKVTVSDGGTGFELPESMSELPRRGKLGLMGIQERVWLLGGTLRLNTAPGKGTTIQVEVPYIKRLPCPLPNKEVKSSNS